MTTELAPGGPVVHPEHYNSHPSGIECWDLVELLPFNEGNAVKYIWRAGLKDNAVQDLDKAMQYLDREATRLQAANRVDRAVEARTQVRDLGRHVVASEPDMRLRRAFEYLLCGDFTLQDLVCAYGAVTLHRDAVREAQNGGFTLQDLAHAFGAVTPHRDAVPEAQNG